MKTFQGNIKISSGKINSLVESDGSVNIHTGDKKYEFKNAFALPGLTDAHGHIIALGRKLNGLNLEKCTSAESCVSKALNYFDESSNWIIGFGWNNELWDNNKMPHKSLADNAFKNTPVCLTRVDGHAAWVNSIALIIAGINKNSDNPPGGLIQKDNRGEPTGILFDDAIDLVKRHIPEPTIDQIKNDILSACHELTKNGITCVHDMDVNPALIPIYKELNYENLLPLRIYSFISGHNEEWLDYKIKPYAKDLFNIVGVKFYADGSLGSRSAAMLKPYSDAQDQNGIFLTNEDDLYRKSIIAIQQGFHVAAHAIGDAGARLVLNVFNNIRKNPNVNKDAVLRIEHAQHFNREDLKLFHGNNIITAVQPVHCISDAASIAEKRLGKRCKDAYLWKSLIDAGANLIASSDFPIEDHNPFVGIDALVNRIPYGKKNIWFPKEKLDLESAIRSYTLNPYLSLKSKSLIGELKLNYNADLTIVDRDILLSSNINSTNVIAVFVNGIPVYL